MLQRRNPDHYTAEKLELAGRQLGRIERTIRDLVEFSRPTSAARSRVRVAEVIDDVLGIAKYYQRTGSRQITTDLPPDLPPIVTVRDHLTQVVLNLLLNAIDATGTGGHIHVVADHDGDRLRLSVLDDGRGIPEEDRARLFQPYFTTKPQGTGLGLFVCRRIVEEMGGGLTCESEEGRGATFTIALPAPRKATLLVASTEKVLQ
jgi:signal transduction histidine kinase